MTRCYFAYGSNLCAVQMGRRCPAAEEGEVAELAGWRFVINRRGVATVVPEPGARVLGLIWRLTPACEAALDRYEGVAKGVYRKEELEAGGAPALVYLAAETALGAPRDGYLECILRAAEVRGFDAEYRAELTRWTRPFTVAAGRC
jgi:AIG2-like family